MENTNLPINSKSLAELLNIPIDSEVLSQSFCKDILKDIDFCKKIEEIRSVSSNVTCFRDIPNKTTEDQHLPVYVFDVDVICWKNKLTVRERVSINSNTTYWSFYGSTFAISIKKSQLDNFQGLLHWRCA